MEFEFGIDDVFPNRITVLTPPVLKHLIKRDSDLKRKYKEAIDRLGQSSAEAQRLPSVITLFNKFLIADASCHLFVLRKGEARRKEEEEIREAGGGNAIDVDQNNSNAFGEEQSFRFNLEDDKAESSSPKKGTLLGFLKVGPKDLFLHNEAEELVKVKPVCVLDFYVSENSQRQGCGKTLFDFMLGYFNREEGVESRGDNFPSEPCHFAYDRPSDKLLPFLKKHYNLSQAVPQFNKFFISTGFFDSHNPCWGNNNNNSGMKMDTRQSKGRMPHSRSGGSFFPYSSGAGARAAGAVSGNDITAGTIDHKRRRWFSEDSISGREGWTVGEKNRPKSDITPSGTLQGDILGGLENVSIGSSKDDRGRYSRHMSDPNATLSQQQSTPQTLHPTQTSPQPQREQLAPYLQPQPPAASSAVPRSLSLDLEAKPEDTRLAKSQTSPSPSSTREWSSPRRSRNWTSTPRIPIGSEISNPRGKVSQFDPLSPSASTVSNAFIWMPSSTPVNHRTKAPFATTSPKSRVPPSASPSANQMPPGNKRFQRTSLW